MRTCEVFGENNVTMAMITAILFGYILVVCVVSAPDLEEGGMEVEIRCGKI